MRRSWWTAAALAISAAPGVVHGQAVRVERYQHQRADRLLIRSDVLGEERELLVGLPRGFHADSAHPVVVVLDGEVVFEAMAALASLMADANEIPASIVVGIPVRGREPDFAPRITGIPESGGADRILEHLRSEVFPVLDSLYHIGTDRILWGHSAIGGLFCTYALLGPDTQFTGILSSSPNLRFTQEYIDRPDAFAQLATKHRTFYYLTFGGDEAPAYMGEMYDLVRALNARLERGAPGNLVWKYSFLEDNNHFTNAIETYVDGLKLYFGAME